MASIQCELKLSKIEIFYAFSFVHRITATPSHIYTALATNIYVHHGAKNEHSQIQRVQVHNQIDAMTMLSAALPTTTARRRLVVGRYDCHTAIAEVLVLYRKVSGWI